MDTLTYKLLRYLFYRNNGLGCHISFIAIHFPELNNSVSTPSNYDFEKDDLIHFIFEMEKKGYILFTEGSVVIFTELGKKLIQEEINKQQ